MYEIVLQNNRLLVNGNTPSMMAILGATKNKKGTSFPKDTIVIDMLYCLDDKLFLSNEVVIWYRTSIEERIKRTNIAGKNYISELEIYSQLNHVITEYQRQAIEFLLTAKKCILGDDMGLGKTITALATIDHVKAKNVLVVCPSHVKYNWQYEIKKWVPHYNVYIADGSKVARNKTIEDYISDYKRKILIVNYEMFTGKAGRQVVKGIRRMGMIYKYPELVDYYDVVVFDEAHRLKNRKTQIMEGIKNVQSDYKFLMTGTPISKKPTDLFQLLHIIDSKRFTSYWNFAFFYCNTIKNRYGGYEVLGITRLQEYQLLLKEFMLRRLKEDVIDLPKKLVNEIHIKLSAAHRKAYKKLFNYEMGDGTIIESDIELAIRLGQCAQSPRCVGYDIDSSTFEAIEEVYSDIVEANENMRVIIAFDSKVAAISFFDSFKSKNKYFISGDVKIKDRNTYLEKFESNKEGVLITTIRALSEGVNMDYCNNIIFSDISFSNGTNAQFMDRIHRMTSIQIKNYYHIIIDDTYQAYKYYRLKDETSNIAQLLNDSEKNVELQIGRDYLNTIKGRVKK